LHRTKKSAAIAYYSTPQEMAHLRVVYH